MTTPSERSAELEEALKVCASEAIQRIGHIQPIGVLLGFDRDSWRIRAASANVETLFGLRAQELIGRPLADLLEPAQYDELRSLIAGGDWTGARLCSLALPHAERPTSYDAQIYLDDALCVLEIESQPVQPDDVFHTLFIPIRDALWKLDAETDIARYAQLAVEQVRMLSGFDRVMMYRFDVNWDGEVIAESKLPQADSYLGNRFPASDIPPQARALYTRNLIRAISDIDAVPLEILTDTGLRNNGTIDLSHSWLRSMSPVHLEYLRNMGVKASMSISLVQNDQLWGLIACHHFSPRHVGLRARELNEFVGRVVSLKLLNMDTAERDLLRQRIRDTLVELTRLIRASQDLDTVIILLKERLLGLVRASGAVISIDGARHRLGEAPDDAVLRRLIERLRRMPAAPVLHSDELALLLDESDRESVAASGLGGMMVAPLDHHLQNFVMWFRPGILRTLRWAGNPSKTIVHDASGPRISPRTSFDTWIETYRDKSLPWSQVEIDAAGSLSMALIELLAQKALEISEESYRLLAENSTDMIARLDLQGVFHFASPSCRDLFGRRSEELIGLTLADVFDEPASSVARDLTQLQALGAMVTRVLRGRRADGGELWVEATLKHTIGRRGEQEILLNARNVTQRHNYQRAIEEVQRRHTQILEAAGEGVVSLDQRGCIIYANEVAARLLGREARDLVGMQCDDAFDFEERPAPPELCPFLATLQDGQTRQGSATLRAGGGVAAVRVGFICTPLAQRETGGCVIVFSDNVNAADGQDADTADRILDQATEAIMVTDAHRQIVSVNRAFTEITGYTAEEALGKTPKLLKSGVHTPHFYKELWDSLNDKRRWSGEIWNRRRNGEIYPQWGSISAILDHTGKVKNYVAVFSDISRAKQAEEKLFYLANHDTLTGLANRMHFTESLNLALERCRRHQRKAAVLFIDLDRFKIVNDTLGHSAGDTFLRQIAERLERITRKHDALARWGGDEFVMLLDGFGEATSIESRVRNLIAALAEPLYLAGHELLPTASIGIAQYPDDALKSVDLIKAADIAMYSAKQLGRNGFQFYSRVSVKDLTPQLTLATELRHALDEQQFFLVYQPQVDPCDATLKGVEALLRWRHPLRGELSPTDFVPMIEELGLMCDLGNWVLAEACRQLKEWADGQVAIPKVSVNVSPQQLRDTFVHDTAETIRDSGIDPGRLELEITEGALESGDVARSITLRLRSLGVRLAVDDFGTGYSSLAHLKRFPISCFKIDKSFVDGIPQNEADVAIVRTILGLGKSFGVEIIAEGVEAEEQMRFLRDEGVTTIQGFFFARPMRPADLLRWISTHSH